MNKLYTSIWGRVLVLGSVVCLSAFFSSALAQDCTPRISYFNILPSEETIDGVLYKKVQVVVNNDHPGQAEKFYFLFDGADRTAETKSYEYGYNTEVFLVPVDVERITFYDFNSFNCTFDFFPEFTPNRCTFNFDQYIDLSAGDCYNRTVTYSVKSDVVIDSVAWLRNGNSTPVHDQMIWQNIPPGSYEIYFYDDQGCEATTNLSTCTSRSNAGEGQNLLYCIGEDDTLNLYDHLSLNIDSGIFYTENYTPLDSLDAIGLSYDSEGEYVYSYVASNFNEIPDTSYFNIQVRDCSECAYELISASRLCSSPEILEVTIGGGNQKDNAFRVTFPDGSTTTETFYVPFELTFPDYTDSLELAVQWDTPTGTCDSILQIGPVSNPSIQIATSEISLPSDSVGIEVSVDQGMAPYQVDIFLGDQQEYLELDEGETIQIDFLKSHDTAIIIAMDDQGCMGTDTLLLIPDCPRPVVEVIPDICGTGAGQITLDNSSLPPGSQVSWADSEATDLWERSKLAPDTYQFTVTHGECVVSEEVIVEEGTEQIPDVITSNDCLLDGMFEVFVQDSGRVREWKLGDAVLPGFFGSFPANQDLIFTVESTEGCIDTVLIKEEEMPWLEAIEYNESGEMSARLGLDVNLLQNYGWKERDSILCVSCLDFSQEEPEAGTYEFYVEQFPGCRADTLLVIEDPPLSFLMPNAITPMGTRNRRLQIFDPLDKMASVLEFQVFDRFGNLLFQKFDFLPDDDGTINWPDGTSTHLPSMIVCVAKIQSKEGKEMILKQDVLILR